MLVQYRKRCRMLRSFFLFILFLTIAWNTSAQSIGNFDDQMSVGDDFFIGEASYTDGTYEILGSGSDIGGTADGMYWVYSELSQNFIITADMEWGNQEIPGGEPNAGSGNKKMGIVVREDPEYPGARNVSAVLMNASANNTNANMKWRLEPDGGTAEFSQQPKAADETNTLRLFRDGNTFIMFRGTTDGGFKRFGEISVPDMPETVYVGLAVSANNVSALERAYFSNVSLIPLDVTVRATRSFSKELVNPSETVRTTIALNITGGSTDVTVNEIPPAGIAVDNITATEGEVNQQNGVLVWSIPNASGTPSLSYNVTAPPNAGTLRFQGTLDAGGTYSLSVEGTQNLGVEAAVTGERKIVYILRDVGVNSKSDQLIMLDLQVFFGADVKDFDHNNLPGFEMPDDLSEADMVFSSETVQSGNVANQGYHRDFEVPQITGEQALLDDYSYGGSGNGTTSGTTLDIIDNEHPITQGFPLGELQILDTPQDLARLNSPPDGVRVLATVAGNPGQAALWVIEEGDFVNGTESLGIRIGTWLQGREIYATMNDEGRQLMINVFAYALGVEAPQTAVEDFMLY